MKKDFRADEKMKYILINMNKNLETYILNFAIDSKEKYLLQWVEKFYNNVAKELFKLKANPVK